MDALCWMQELLLRIAKSMVKIKHQNVVVMLKSTVDQSKTL